MKRLYGYTLVELISVLLVVAILGFVAIPGWHQLIASNQATAAANQLVGAINLARSEAIMRGLVVTLCASKDQKTCSGQWSDGQMVFIEKHSKKQDNEIEILRVYNSLPNNARLTWNKKGSLQMIPFGALHTQPSTFCYLPANADRENSRTIIVSLTGRVRVSQQGKCD